MANIKVSEMTQADSVNDLDLLMIVQGNTNKKVTKQTLLEEVNNRVAESEENISALQTDLDTSKETIEQNQKDIQELQEENENLKNALPTITGTGTDITLNKTSKNKFKVLDIKGNTEQTQLSGKNLFDNRIVISGMSYNSENDLFTFHRDSGTDFLITINKLNLKPNTNYILYMNITENTMSAQMSLVSSSTSFLEGTFVITAGETGTKAAQIVTKSSTDGLLYDLWFYCANASGNLKAQIMLVEGTTAGNYEPYCGGTASPNPEYPQAIKNVTGNVNVKIENKNLVFEQMKGYNILSDGTFSLDATYDIHIARIEAGKEYTLNSSPNTFVGGFFYTLPQSSSQSYNSLRVIDTNTTFIAPITGYVAFRSVANYEKPYLEQGSTATDYVEHQEQNLPFTLASGQKLMLGDSLQDDGMHNARTQTILGTVESLLSLTIFGTACKIGIFTLPNAKNVGRSYNFKSNKISPANETFSKYTAYRNGTSLYVLTTQDDTVENFNSKISGAIVEYELAEEEITPYNETQQEQYNAIKEAMSYYEQTNITSTSEEVGPIIDAEAIADMNSLLSDLETRLLTLESEV